MTRLTEEMVIARTRANDLANIRKLNVWGSGLSDVTLLRKMQNVEVLSLSVNKINSLEDFQWCRNLQELYVRRNEIKDLNQVCYLRELPRLRSLWLDENPCSACDLYRVTVLRALPHLQKLDNVPVAPEEVQEALRRGLELCHPEEVKQNPALAEQPHFNNRAPPSPPSPLRSPTRHERGGGRTGGAPSDPESEPHAHHRRTNPLDYDDDDFQDQRNANCHDNDNAPYGRTVNNQYHNNSYERPPLTSAGESPSPGDDLSSSLASSLHSQPPSKVEDDRGDERVAYARPAAPSQLDLQHGQHGQGLAATQRCSPGSLGSLPQVPQTQLGVGLPTSTRRPIARNSNILSAVLCLIKELDFPSLEVVEVAVRSRMDEF